MNTTRAPNRIAALLLGLLALAGSAQAQTLLVTPTRGANLREKPDLASPVVDRVVTGTELEVVERVGQWYEIVVPATGTTAFVHASVVRLIEEEPLVSAGPASPAEPPAPETERSSPELPPPPAEPKLEGSPAERPPRTSAEPAGARPPRFWSRFTLAASGALAAGGGDFRGQRRFTDFAEEGMLDAAYSRGAGPAFELGLEYPLRGRLSMAGAFALVRRTGSATYTAAIPHPLYLGRPRTATGPVSDLSYRERAVHLDLVYHSERGRMRYAVFAGPSYAGVTSELLEPPQYRQSYPFDEVEVLQVPRGAARGSGFGFNLGGAVDYRWRDRLGMELLVRYHRAPVELTRTAQTVDADAGGLQVGVGLKLYFRSR